MNLHRLLALLLALTFSARAGTVRIERLDPAATNWSFRTIPGPSRSDAATGAAVTFLHHAAEPQGSAPDALTDGLLPRRANQAKGFAFFSNEDAVPGAMLMDLGRSVAIAAINSYSWHEFPPEGDCRAPQVFTLYASNAERPDPERPESADWMKIADVDTRPNTTGEIWGGRHGVSIGDARQPVGTFRWLLWATKPTASPKARDARWTHSFFCELDVHTAETLAQAGDAEIQGAQLREVVVVFKTHFDIGYTDLASNVIQRYRTAMIDRALDIMDASRSRPANEQFVWTVPGWPLKQILDGNPSPERRERIARAFREGRLAVHAMPFTLETESLDVEDMVRGLRFSADLARQYGVPQPRAAKLTDVPEHTWGLATILARGGIDFLHIGCNGGSAYPLVPPLFWWEGPDGSRLLTAYSTQYGTDLVPPADWPYRTWLAMLMTGDNHGPPTPAEVSNVLARAARELPGVKIRFGKLEDFADAIRAEQPKLPVVRADLPDTWIHGLMAMPQDSQLARNVRPLLPALEALDTHLRLAGVKTPDLAAPLADAYEHTLLYGEHTWGLFGSSPGPFRYGDDWKKARAAGTYARFERSFDDHRAYIRHAAAIATNELRARLDLLAVNVNATGPRVVVQNPLPWPRSGEVTATLPDGAVLTFRAADVPASGHTTFTIEEARSRATGGPSSARPSDRLENKALRVTLDPARGGIASIVDKQTGRELVDPGAAQPLGAYLFERFSTSNVDHFVRAYARGGGGWVRNDFGKPNMPGPDQVPYFAASPTNWTLERIDATHAVLRCTNAAPFARSLELAVSLGAADDFVELEWSIADKTSDPLPEGGWLCLPFNVKSPAFRIGRPGSIIDPTRDIFAGSGRHLLAVASGVTVTGADGWGAGICAIDAPLVSLGRPGLWEFTYDYVPSDARVFVNLHNNEWNTNFPLWQEGSWRSRVRLWVVRGRGAESDLITPSAEARLPLMATYADGPAGALPKEANGLGISRRGVAVTAFGPDPYGHPGTLLRLWEEAGTAGTITVSLPAGLHATRALPVDLRSEKAGEPIAIRKGRFDLTLPAFAPVTLLLE